MKKKAFWLAAVFVTSVTMVLLGCKAKEKEEGKGKAPPAKEKPTTAKGKPQTRIVLTCGMPGHPQFEPGEEPEDGRCPVCEMKLVKKEIPTGNKE